MANYSILVLGCLFLLATLAHAGVRRNRRYVIPYNPDDLNGFNPDGPEVWKKWNALKKHGTLHGLADLFGPFNIAEFFSRIAVLASAAKERIDNEERSYGYGYELNGFRQKRHSSKDDSFGYDFPYDSPNKPGYSPFGKNFPFNDPGPEQTPNPKSLAKERIDSEERSYELNGIRKKREQGNINFRDNFPYGSSYDESFGNDFPFDSPNKPGYSPFGNNFPFNSPNKNEPFGNEFPFDNPRPEQKPKPKNGIDPLYSLMANLARYVFRSEAAARFFEKYKGRQRYDELFYENY